MSPTETLTFERKNAKETGPEQNMDCNPRHDYF